LGLFLVRTYYPSFPYTTLFRSDYWGGAPAADTLTVRIIPEPLTRAAEFEAGRLSVMEVPFGETAQWRRQHPDLLLEKPALRVVRSEEHTSELQSLAYLVCRLLL